MKYPTDINIIRVKNYKNPLLRILRENEIIYYENSFKNYDFPRKTWNLIKDKIGKTEKLSQPEALSNTNGVKVRRPPVAYMFSDYFTGVGRSIIAAGIDSSPCRSHKQYLPPTECTSIFLAPVGSAEFQKIIKNIRKR